MFLRLMLDTTGMRFMVSTPAKPKTDKNGNQRLDKATGQPMYSLDLYVRQADAKPSVISVTVVGKSPDVKEDEIVSVPGLQANPWLNDNKVLNIAYRAENVVPVNRKSAA